MAFPFSPTRRRQRGFTLIELMITVAIIAILARIAYPAYLSSVSKSRRADAKSALLDLAQREERFMSTANVYSNTATDLGFATGTTFPIAVLSGSKSYYNMAVTLNATNSTYSVTATPTGSQTSDACGTYSLNSAGVQSVSGGTSTAADCW